MTALMVPDRPLRAAWRDNANLALVSLLFILLPVLAHAGGLGIAPVAAIAGLCGFALVGRPAPSHIPSWIWALTAFLLWAGLTSFWSPYEDTQTLTNPVKLIIGVALFLLVDTAVREASHRAPVFFRRLVVSFFIAGLLALLYDILSGYKLTYLVDPLGEEELVLWKNSDILRNLGHAVVVASLILSFILAMISGDSFMRKALMLGLIVLTVAVAILHKLDVAYVAVGFALLVMLLARRKPRLAIKGITGLAIAMILAAPLFGVFSKFMSQNIRDAMPFSWEHRVAMWDYVLDRIMEAPLLGHGFDAARTFNDTMTIRGQADFSIVALHPHNAGLHIWVETGLIGAILASLAVFFLGQSVLKSIVKRPEWAVPLAGFAATAIVINAVTYGVWQDWWWASLIVIPSLRHIIPPHLSAIRRKNDFTTPA